MRVRYINIKNIVQNVTLSIRFVKKEFFKINKYIFANVKFPVSRISPQCERRTVLSIEFHATVVLFVQGTRHFICNLSNIVFYINRSEEDFNIIIFTNEYLKIATSDGSQQHL